MKFWSNQRFLQKFNHGNEKAYFKVYDFFAPKIFRFIYYKVGKNKNLSEELTQRTFCKTWEHITAPRKKVDNIQAFIYQVARNLVIDHWRQTKKANLPISQDLTDKIQDTTEHVDTQINIQTIKQALEQIPDRYQEIITLRYFEDLDIQEICLILKKDKSNVYVLIHRALARLRGVIKTNAKS